jgi:hypothetical protein
VSFALAGLRRVGGFLACVEQGLGEPVGHLCRPRRESGGDEQGQGE